MTTAPGILIVDDDASFRETWTLALDDLGYSSKAVGSETEAMREAEKTRYDVAIVDLMLQGSGGGPGGLAVVRGVLDLTPDCHVIVVTAYPGEATIEKAFAAGASDYLIKDTYFKVVLGHKLAAAVERTRIRNFASRSDRAREKQVLDLHQDCLREPDPNRKGALLEDLVVLLLSSIEGFVPSARRRNEIEELDVWVRNESADPFWQKEAQFLLVECKNWSSPTPASVLREVRDKVRYKAGRCRTGFVFAVAGFRESAAGVLKQSQGDDILVVPVDGDGIGRLAGSRDRGAVLKGFYELAVRANGVGT